MKYMVVWLPHFADTYYSVNGFDQRPDAEAFYQKLSTNNPNIFSCLGKVEEQQYASSAIFNGLPRPSSDRASGTKDDKVKRRLIQGQASGGAVCMAVYLFGRGSFYRIIAFEHVSPRLFPPPLIDLLKTEQLLASFRKIPQTRRTFRCQRPRSREQQRGILCPCAATAITHRPDRDPARSRLVTKNRSGKVAALTFTLMGGGTAFERIRPQARPPISSRALTNFLISSPVL
jgi:hypothetical protein